MRVMKGCVEALKFMPVIMGGETKRSEYLFENARESVGTGYCQGITEHVEVIK